jgi:hypothetical protein
VGQDETAEVRQVADMIEQHFQLHPTAADTAEGVWRYWGPAAAGASREMVERALALLARAGRVLDRELPDGGVIYVHAGSPRGAGEY